MSSDAGRQKILDYLEANNIKLASLAVKYGMSRNEVSNIMHGQKLEPKGHEFIVRVIDDFKIR